MESELRQQVVDTGLLLLEKKLVARTWGNVSARVDGTHFLITTLRLRRRIWHSSIWRREHTRVNTSLQVRREFTVQRIRHFLMLNSSFIRTRLMQQHFR